VGKGVDTSKQEILARLVAAETEAQRKVDEATALAQQTVTNAKQSAAQMIEEVRKQAADDAANLEANRAQESQEEAAAHRTQANQLDQLLKQRAEKNLDAAVKLIVDWVTCAGG
jgi:vacuolar-type H+-ATPase subunit H